MSLSQNGYTFESIATHSLAQSVTREGVRLQRGEFFGVRGESHIVDEAKGLEFAIEAWLEGYATYPAIQTAFSNILSRRGQLTGTLSLIGTSTVTFPQSTFVDVYYLDPGNGKAAPWYGMASGSNRWVAKIMLTWRQTGVS